MDTIQEIISSIDLSQFNIQQLQNLFTKEQITNTFQSSSLVQIAAALILIALVLKLTRIVISEIINWAILGLGIFIILNFLNLI